MTANDDIAYNYIKPEISIINIQIKCIDIFTLERDIAHLHESYNYTMLTKLTMIKYFALSNLHVVQLLFSALVHVLTIKDTRMTYSHWEKKCVVQVRTTNLTMAWEDSMKGTKKGNDTTCLELLQQRASSKMKYIQLFAEDEINQ